MISTTMLCALGVALQSHQVYDQNILGRLRSEFGDPYSIEEAMTSKGDSKQLSNLVVDHFSSSLMLFPVGAADRRYYLSWLESESGVVRWFLIYETKRRSRIHVEWIQPLQAIPTTSRNDYGEVGTLAALLEYERLRPKGVLSPKVRQSLSAKKMFASYRFLVGPGWMDCGYVDRSGKLNDDLRTNFKGGKLVPLGVFSENLGYEWPYSLPRTPFDYPIIHAESDEIDRMWKSKAKRDQQRPVSVAGLDSRRQED